MLKIKDLHVSVDEQEILKGLSLEVGEGELHAVMGPNGSGKSTLGYTLAGRDDYEVTSGSIEFDGEDLVEMEPDERAAAGVFLAFQYPVEIPGVNNAYFLRSRRRFLGISVPGGDPWGEQRLLFACGVERAAQGPR